jgi:hypothetical protein
MPSANAFRGPERACGTCRSMPRISGISNRRWESAAAILGIAVSDRETLEGLTQFALLGLCRGSKLFTLRRRDVEWWKEHAWKAVSVSCTE